MEIPEGLQITIEWIDEKGKKQKVIYIGSEVDSAETHIGLITGNICLGDLEP